MVAEILLGIVLVVMLIVGVQMYNNLIRLRNELERAWSNIDVVLKQRFDELPQLIQVIEQYSSYEAGLIEKVANARAHYGSARSISEKMQASNELSVALSGVMAIGEAYPELKANQNFLQLQTRVSQLENIISDRRELYNQTVANFNTRIDQFPDVIAARILNYQRQELFKAAEIEREKPSLKMNLPKFG